jgi:hypothetical protein
MKPALRRVVVSPLIDVSKKKLRVDIHGARSGTGTAGDARLPFGGVDLALGHRYHRRDRFRHRGVDIRDLPAGDRTTGDDPGRFFDEASALGKNVGYRRSDPDTDVGGTYDSTSPDCDHMIDLGFLEHHRFVNRVQRRWRNHEQVVSGNPLGGYLRKDRTDRTVRDAGISSRCGSDTVPEIPGASTNRGEATTVSTSHNHHNVVRFDDVGNDLQPHYDSFGIGDSLLDSTGQIRFRFGQVEYEEARAKASADTEKEVGGNRRTRTAQDTGGAYSLEQRVAIEGVPLKRLDHLPETVKLSIELDRECRADGTVKESGRTDLPHPSRNRRVKRHRKATIAIGDDHPFPDEIPHVNERFDTAAGVLLQGHHAQRWNCGVPET